MSAIFGLARLDATEYPYVVRADQRLIYDATLQYVNMQLTDVSRAEAVFIQEQTELVQERYQLPGSGRMTQRADGVRGAAVRAYNGWNVAYPIYDYGEQIAATRVDMAYLTPQEYERHVNTIITRYVNERRWQMLHHLMDDGGGSAFSFDDKRAGTLSVQPLANGDSVVYPPVMGSTTEATEDHYSESGYADSSISDSNNPLITLRDELVEHFGSMTGGDNIVAFVNNADMPYLEDLTDFTPVEDRFIRSGSNVDVPFNLPNVPGTIRGRANGVWVVEWRWVPDNYLLALHLEAAPPLKERVHPAATGLARGLHLQYADEAAPIESAEWGAYFGFGCGNRLNGAVLELGTGGTYTVPTAYD